MDCSIYNHFGGLGLNFILLNKNLNIAIHENKEIKKHSNISSHFLSCISNSFPNEVFLIKKKHKIIPIKYIINDIIFYFFKYK